MSLQLAQHAEEARPGWWKWAMWLDGTPDELANVREVVYTLHPTFPQPVQTIVNRGTKFRLESAGWGEFMIFATVKMVSNQELSLRHWLKFDGADSAATAAAATETPTIFLSSAAADEWFADALQDSLERQHAYVLRPSDNVLAGIPLAAWLAREHVGAAVMVLSDAKSPWIEQELQAVGERVIPVVPVLVGHADARVPAQLLERQTLRAPDRDAELNGIAEQIIRIIRAGTATPPPLISSRGGSGLVNYAELYAVVRDRSRTTATTDTATGQVETALRTLKESQAHPDVMTASDDPSTAAVQSWVAEFVSPPRRTTKFMTGFSNADWLGWIGSTLKWSTRKAEWKIADPRPDPIGNRFRAALFGNWATGLYGAPVCAATIARDPAGFALLVHLGDTFYSGTEEEIRSRLIGAWPPAKGSIGRVLNGNHEMYSGGQAYFGLALPHFDQHASYFAFQNAHWLLAGLDTSYADNDLYGEQMDWLTRLVSQAGDRRLVLFSHHFPYSLIESRSTNLVEKFKALLDAQRIFAWYWGHEIDCVLYDRDPAWRVWGRAIGHGGLPYQRDRRFGAPPPERRWIRLPAKEGVPAGDMLDGPNPYVIGHEQEYGPHGFAVLEFDGPRLLERIVDAGGEVLRTTELTADR